MKKIGVLLLMNLFIRCTTTHQGEHSQHSSENSILLDSSTTQQSTTIKTTNALSHSAKNIIENGFDINNVRIKFKYQQLKKFDSTLLESSRKNPLVKGYQPIYAADYTKVFQHESTIEDSILAQDFFFSLQTTHPYIGITIISEVDGIYTRIQYRSYKKDGLFIDQVELCGQGGDAGWNQKSFGRFIN